LAIVCALLNLYVLALIARAVLSFFPLRPDSGLIPIVRALDTIIDPVLMPLRRIIPPAGMFDLSFLVLFLLIQFLIMPALGCGLVI
jgi:YggT family protein